MLCNNAALLSLVTVTAVFGRKFALMVLPEMSGLPKATPPKLLPMATATHNNPPS
jgi:hypothetical protein